LFFHETVGKTMHVTLWHLPEGPQDTSWWIPVQCDFFRSRTVSTLHICRT